MITRQSIIDRGIFWEGSIHKEGGNSTNYRVGFNSPGHYYLPEICHTDHACRFLVDYKDECFGWGYKGRGPKQLALTMLVNTQLKLIRSDGFAENYRKADCALAVKHHVAFMEEVISKLPDKWELTGEFIMDWLAKKEGVREPGSEAVRNL